MKKFSADFCSILFNESSVPSMAKILMKGLIFLFVGIFSYFSGYGQEDLQISKIANKATANPGDVITYIISYSNAGTKAASNVVITDILPDPGTYTYVSSSPAGVKNGNTLEWTSTQISGLASLQGGENQIIVTLKAGVPGNGTSEAPQGYYISVPSTSMENHAEIKSDLTTVPVTSDLVTTNVVQYAGVKMNDASAGVIKSATGISLFYMMQVTNTGNIYDKFEFSTLNHECAGKSFDPLTAEFTDIDGNIILDSGWLKPGESYIFYFKLTTPVGSNPGKWSCNTVIATSVFNPVIQGSGEVATEILGSPKNPLVELSKIDSKSSVAAGDVFTYTLYAFNANNSYPANNFVLHETYDSNITFISSEPAPDPGYNNRWSLGSLEYGLGAAKTVKVTVQVNANASCEGSIANNIWASYTGYSAGNPPRAAITTQIKSYPDLEITKSVNAASFPVIKGNILTYTLSYINKGSCNASGVEVNDYFDDSHTNVINSGGGIVNSDHISWNLGTLTPGQSGSITYTVEVDPNVVFSPGTTSIPNMASISTTVTESNYNNNNAYANIQVSTLPDLKVELTINPILTAGSPSTYTLKVTNNGDIEASEVNIENVLPVGVTSGTISDGGINNSGIITWPTIPVLTVGGSVSYTFTVTPQCQALPSISNTASATSLILDKNPLDNSSTLVSPVIDNTLPEISKSPVTRNIDGCGTNAIFGPVYSSTPAASSYTEFSNATNQGIGVDLYCGITSVTYQDVASGTCSIVVTRTWTLKDAAGNSASCEQTINVNHSTAPSVPSEVSDVVDCLAEAVPPPLPAVTDFCGNVITPVLISTVDSPDPINCEGTRTYTYSYTDCSGLSSTWRYVYTIDQTTAPVMPADGSSSVECLSAATAPLTPVITDACGRNVAAVLVSTVDSPDPISCEGTRTYTYSYTDCSGLSSTWRYVYTIDQTTAPVMPADGSSSVECLSAATAPLTPVITDACGRNVAAVLVSTVDNPGAGASESTRTYTYSYTDCSGLSSSWRYVYTIKDNSAPQLTGTIPSGQTGINACLLNVPEGPTIEEIKALYIDNCDGEVFVTKSSSITGKNCDWTVTYTYIIRDSNNNTAPDVVITYSGGDTSNEWQTVPGSLNRTVQYNDLTDLESAQALVPVISGNCNTLSPVKSSGAFVTGSCPQSGTYTNTWTATDDCGNIIGSPFVQTITVIDDLAPVWITPANALNVTLKCNDAAGLITAQAMSPEAQDNSGISLSVVKISGLPEPTVCKSGTYVNTWTTSDNCGNLSQTYTQVITIVDDTPPVISALPIPSVIPCSAIPQFATPTVADDCDPNPQISYVDVVTPGSCSSSYSITRTWTAIDACGNEGEKVSQIISVVDDKAPVITTSTGSLDRSLQCSDESDLSVILALRPEATDNCSQSINLNLVSDTTTPDITNNSYKRIRKWNFTDECSNISEEFTQTISVKDTEKPVITAPADVNVTTDPDKCAATGVNLGTPVTSDNCSVISVSNNAVEPFAQGNTIVTWTVTDGAGNIQTATQTVRVTDAQRPVIIAPSNVLINSDQGKCSASGVSLGTPVTSDNCSVTAVSNNAVEPFASGNTIVIWTVTDGAGNIQTATQTVTVTDIQKPVITAPSAILLNADPGKCTASGVALGTPVTSDNCTVSSVTNNAVEPFAQGNTIVTWTVRDGSGNVETATQMITVTDAEKPTATAPSDLTVNTDPGKNTASGVSLGIPAAVDNCAVATITNDAPALFTLGEHTVTWTIADPSGNTTKVTQLVKVMDNQKPVFTDCLSGNNQVAIANTGVTTYLQNDVTWNPSTNDNDQIASMNYVLSGATSGTGTTLQGVKFNMGLTNVIWTASDSYGNSTTCAFTVTVIDKESPVFTACRTGQELILKTSLRSSTYKLTGSMYDFKATDNDRVASLTYVLAGATSGSGTSLNNVELNPGHTDIIWTALDPSGNSSSCQLRVLVQDTNIPPEANDDQFTVKESAELNGDVRTNDSDIYVPLENLRVQLVNSVSHGKLEIGAAGTFTYTADPDYIGEDHFTYSLCKDNLLCDQATVSITVTINTDCPVFVPNGFSPNGDGINDYLKIRCLYNYPDAILKVYTRSGVQVYEQKHYGNIDYWGSEKQAYWNGETGNKWNIGGKELISATYIYILELVEGKKEKVLTGSIFINK